MVSGKLVLLLSVVAAGCSVSWAIPQKVDNVDKYLHCQTCGKFSLIVDGFTVALYKLLVGIGIKVPHALAYALHLTLFLIAVLGQLKKAKNQVMWEGVSNMINEVVANEYLRGYLKECGLKLIGIIECVLSKLHIALNW